jgi:acetyl-CoA carboxylase biotin carboxyl carrier protein
MEFDCLLALIDKVSSSELGSFEMEDGSFRLSLKKQKKESLSKEQVVTVEREVVQAAAPAKEQEPDGTLIKAPLVGTFYQAASPEEAPFVKVGDRVQKGQVLGIIEAMKLMNEVESECDGVVKEILISNEQMVEYGQPMFVIS